MKRTALFVVSSAVVVMACSHKLNLPPAGGTGGTSSSGGATGAGGSSSGTIGSSGGTAAGSCNAGIDGACCYQPDQDGIINGSPACGWKRLANGDHVSILVRKVDTNGSPTGSFQSVDMQALVPQIPTMNDCGASPSGYVLTFPGGTGGATNGIQDFSVGPAGDWTGVDEGAGSVSAVVDPAGDAGAPNPHAAVYACSGIFAKDAIGGVNVMTSVEFSTSMGTFEADFAADSKLRGDGSPTGYYLVFVK